ncbi:hypothetical protein Pla108_28000 [Botrimarina colliarenosi]|uniref:PEP-CTERM protein-sorting domain-containing protein n=1 Tax=Botrimarina colliarenosi TaxID=2528001 RepID=A0A5C6AFN4_9BACT|nr:hypothetical protein [Botrimarina colliarenosi]TWT97023.1 hypothetical protein Pla108_28000 [Botrimarina colliarenosi]
MRCLTLLLALTLAAPAIGGVVSRDLFEPGDGLLTYDDVNQREWLEPAAATLVDYTQEEFLSDLAEGGAYSGFRFATLDDVRRLADSAEAPWGESWSTATPSESWSSPDLSDLFEWNVRRDFGISPGVSESTRYAYGLVATESGSSVKSHTFDGTSVFVILPSEMVVEQTQTTLGWLSPYQSGFDRQPEQRGIAFYATDEPFQSDSGEPVLAYWLYRDAAPVPEPAGLCLALAACLASLRLRALA